MNTLVTFLVIGVATGAVYAIAATGLVVTYVTSNVFNFAHGAIGMLLAFLYYQLRVEAGWPAPLALAVVLLVFAPALGVLLDVALMRRLAGAPVATKLVVTLALLLGTQGVALAVFGNRLRAFPGFFGNRGFRIASVVIAWDQATTILAAIATAVALRLLFRRTRLGVAMRAVVDNPDLTSLTGLSPRRVTAASWALGSMLAGLAAILIAPGLNLDIFVLSLLVVNAFAAAVVGRLQSVPLTFAGALALGVAESLVVGYLPQNNELVRSLKPSMPFIFLFVMLLVRRESRLAQRSQAPVEPAPPSTRVTVGIGAAAVLGAIAVSGMFSDYQILTGSGALVYACITLSLVVLTGLSGQVSLTQLSFVGLGAVVMGKLAGHVPTLAGLLIAGLVTAVVGTVVALPALRLQGIYLALSTLAFALMMDNLVFGNRKMLGGGESLAVPRLSIPGYTFRSEASQFVLLTFFTAVFAIGVLMVRRSSFGRALAAMRDAPNAASMLGLNLVAAKLKVFALSAFMAGLAGALLGGLQVRVGAIDFSYFRSLQLLLIATIFGISSVSGALLGALFFVVLPEITRSSAQGVQAIVVAVGMIAVLNQPEGLAGALRRRARPTVGAALDLVRRRPPPASVLPRATEKSLAVQLELRGVHAGYGTVEVLHDVDLAVPAGSIVALLGANGAGKSTTLKVIAGLVVPRRGSVVVEGHDITGTPPDVVARLGVCLIPEGRGIFPNLTVRENLLMDTYQRPGTALTDVETIAYDRFPVLGKRRAQLAGLLSGGEQQMLALARALATDPTVLLLDEISMGLAPKVVGELFDVVRELASSGMTIVLVEQFVAYALALADYVTVLAHGRVQSVGEPVDVRDALASAYLGT